MQPPLHSALAPVSTRPWLTSDLVRRIFYWPHAQYDVSLLFQSLLMVVVQVILLKVALDHRPSPSSKGGELPFTGAEDSSGFQRPYNFWQWRSPKRCVPDNPP